ncbi:MAG: N-acetyltransferase, partial [Alphaproteobacteria bacterium]
AMEGRWCRLEPLDPAHAADLHAAFNEDREGRIWTYLPIGPFPSLDAYRDWVEQAAASPDPMFFAILVQGRALGHASYLRIAPAAGSIEVGFINYAPALQRSPAATEAMHLMMARAFALGYRRYEWKCDALNAASRRAALRLGFRFEGVFRQATVYKNRNRDTAWYSVIDSEWPALDAAFTRWLDPANFGPDGQQKTRLSELTAALRPASDDADGAKS